MDGETQSIQRFALGLTEALRAQDLLEDAEAIVRVSADSAPCVVAYVVPKPGVALNDPQGLRDLLGLSSSTGAQDWHRHTVLSPVSCIPKLADGRVDTRQLTALPLLTDAMILELEQALAQRPQVTSAIAYFAQMNRPSRADTEITVKEGGSRVVEAHQVAARQEAAPPRSVPPPKSASAYVSGGPLELPDQLPTSLGAALRRTAERHGEKGILHATAEGPGYFQSYAQLLTAAERTISGLHASGLGSGDTAILQVDRLPRYFEVLWACLLGGIVPLTVAVPGDYCVDNAVVQKLANAWRLLEQPRLLASNTLCAGLKSIMAELTGQAVEVIDLDSLNVDSSYQVDSSPAPEAVAFLQLTSGSTGIPKCIQQSHQAIVSHVLGASAANDYSAADTTLNWLPMDHVVPLLTFHLKDVVLGCGQVQLAPAEVVSNPLLWLDQIEAQRVTHSWAPNFGFRLVADALKSSSGHWDLSSLRFLMNAGEQVTMAVVEAFLTAVRPFGVGEQVMQPAFGMAEVCTCMTYNNAFALDSGALYFDRASIPGPLVERPRGAVDTVEFVDLGLPMPGVEIRICEERTRVLPQGCIGDLQIRGAVVSSGYRNNAEQNEESFVGDGWFSTGDLATLIDDHLFITGRSKEMMVVRGANYYCYEIEDIVKRVPGIDPSLVAACGIPNDASGTEEMAIFLVPRDGLDVSTATLVRDARKSVTGATGINPKYVVPIAASEFPRTTSGKIQRTTLKSRLISGVFSREAPSVPLVDIRAFVTCGAQDAGAAIEAVWLSDPFGRSIAVTPERVEGPLPGREALRGVAATPQKMASAGGGVALEGLVAILREVLQSDVSANDDLFDVGIDSLAAAKVAFRLADKFQVEVTPQVLYQHSLVADIARHIDELRRVVDVDQGGPRRDVPWHDPADWFPLSEAQLWLWMLRLDKSTIVRNLVWRIAVHGSLDLDRFDRALNAVLASHDQFWTEISAYRPRQRIANARRSVAADRIDLSPLPGEAREARVRDLYVDYRDRSFDPRSHPKVRAAILSHGEGRDDVLLAAPHLIADPIAMHTFVRDLIQAYATDCAPTSVSPRGRYFDHVLDEQQERERRTSPERTAFWRHRVPDRPFLQLPRGWLYSDDAPYEKPSKPLSAADIDALSGLCAAHRATVSMGIAAIYILTLQRLFPANPAFALALLKNTRDRALYAETLGLFVGYHLISAAPDNRDFSLALARVKQDTLEGDQNAVPQALLFAMLEERTRSGVADRVADAFAWVLTRLLRAPGLTDRLLSMYIRLAWPGGLMGKPPQFFTASPGCDPEEWVPVLPSLNIYPRFLDYGRGERAFTGPHMTANLVAPSFNTEQNLQLPEHHGSLSLILTRDFSEVPVVLVEGPLSGEKAHSLLDAFETTLKDVIAQA